MMVSGDEEEEIGIVDDTHNSSSSNRMDPGISTTMTTTTTTTTTTSSSSSSLSSPCSFCIQVVFVRKYILYILIGVLVLYVVTIDVANDYKIVNEFDPYAAPHLQVLKKKQRNNDNDNDDDDNNESMMMMRRRDDEEKELDLLQKGGVNRLTSEVKDNNNKEDKNHNDDKNKKNNNNNVSSTLEEWLMGVSANQHLNAADVLVCRESVINYVINATDGKDECQGLQKAFDTTCSNDELDQAVDDSQSLHPQQQQQQQQQQQPRTSRRRRKLSEETTIAKFWWGSSSFMSLSDAYSFLFKSIVFPPYQNHADGMYRTNHRRILQSDSNENNDHNGSHNNNETTTTATTATTAATTTASSSSSSSSSSSLTSLALPTKKEHVSEKFVSEALVLHQEQKIIKAFKNITNATLLLGTGGASEQRKEAIHDAAVSSKTLSDTTEIVSAVLNDPTSIEARTCCASILNVYHENCNVDEEEEYSDKRLFLIVAILGFCGMIKSLIRHFKIRWLPEAAGCILVGVVFGSALTFFPHQNMSFDGNWFLRILVPPIVFEAALSIDKRAFHKYLLPILIYAVGGTLMATYMTGWIVHEGTKFLGSYCSTIPYVESFVFGSLISSIDPIAVLSVLSNMGMNDTDTIYVLIFGESLLNDGVAIVLFHTLEHFLDESLVIDREAIAEGVQHFLVVFLGSLMLGIGSGMLCTVYFCVMHGCQTPLVEVLSFFCWALLPYYVCDGIGWSGIVSVVATGFIMDIYVVGRSVTNMHHSDSFSSHLSDIIDDPPSSSLTEDHHLHHHNSNHHHHQKHRQKQKEQQEQQQQQQLEDTQHRTIVKKSIFSGEGYLSEVARTHIHFVAEIFASIMETAIFAYLGLFLLSHRYHWNPWHAAIAIIACCVSRGLMISIMSGIANWLTATISTGGGAAAGPLGSRFWATIRRSRAFLPLTLTNAVMGGGGGAAATAAGGGGAGGGGGGSGGAGGVASAEGGIIIDRRMQIALWVAGLRGAMSFALVEYVPLYDAVTGKGSRLKPELKAMTSASIIFTVFVLGGVTHYMVEHIGLLPGRAKKSTELQQELTPLVKNKLSSITRRHVKPKANELSSTISSSPRQGI